MSFADWKKRSKLIANFSWMYKGDAEKACQAAYKAGERDGRKQIEAEIVESVDREWKIKEANK